MYIKTLVKYMKRVLIYAIGILQLQDGEVLFIAKDELKIRECIKRVLKERNIIKLNCLKTDQQKKKRIRCART